MHMFFSSLLRLPFGNKQMQYDKFFFLQLLFVVKTIPMYFVIFFSKIKELYNRDKICTNIFFKTNVRPNKYNYWYILIL